MIKSMMAMYVRTGYKLYTGSDKHGERITQILTICPDKVQISTGYKTIVCGIYDGLLIEDYND